MTSGKRINVFSITLIVLAVLSGVASSFPLSGQNKNKKEIFFPSKEGQSDKKKHAQFIAPLYYSGRPGYYSGVHILSITSLDTGQALELSESQKSYWPDQLRISLQEGTYQFRVDYSKSHSCGESRVVASVPSGLGRKNVYTAIAGCLAHVSLTEPVTVRLTVKPGEKYWAAAYIVSRGPWPKIVHGGGMTYWIDFADRYKHGLMDVCLEAGKNGEKHASASIYQPIGGFEAEKEAKGQTPGPESTCARASYSVTAHTD